MNTARRLFIAAAIPFSLLAVLLLFLDRASMTGGSTGSPMVLFFVEALTSTVRFMPCEDICRYRCLSFPGLS
jgi:hypothetical protein